MIAGSRGTFVISWAQTEVDGVAGASIDLLTVGATWRWEGSAVRVDGTADFLLLEAAEGAAEIRKRAARMVRRLIGTAVGKAEAGEEDPPTDDSEDLPDQGFIVTDGVASYALTIIPVPDSGSGVICFTPGTRIATPEGPKLIQALRPGEMVLTKDDGPQQVLWMGHRRMSGARLYAMPHLRPIRFRAGALGLDLPEPDLIVSPAHRMLLKGAAAQALFGTSEVLVRAEDLINDASVMVDHALREVTYVHILLERHNIVFANGIETESFHPSNTALEMIDMDQRAELLQVVPGVERRPEAYGDYARRNLSASEAALLRHDIAA